MLSRILTLLLIMPWVAFAAEAEQIQSPASLKQAVRQFLQQEMSGFKGEVVVRVDPVDPRLRLSLCDEGIQPSWPKGGGNRLGMVTVSLRCSGHSPWSIYLRARVAVYAPVVVAARPLGRGERLNAGDVELSRQDVTRISGGYYTEVKAVAGMEVRHSIRAGMVLGTSLVRQPILVGRGERVSITAASGLVRVSMEGKALASGSRGDLIEVMNLSSRQKLEAEVVAPGVVRVRM